MTQLPQTTLRDTRSALPMALLRAREAVMARFRPVLASHGTNEQQWRVLRVLAEAGPLDATEVAARANILAPSLTRMIRSLVQRGFLTRLRDQTDGRRAVLDLTPAARAFIHEVAPHGEAVYAEIEAAFGADRMNDLVALLNDLTAALPRHAGTEEDDSAGS